MRSAGASRNRRSAVPPDPVSEYPIAEAIEASVPGAIVGASNAADGPVFTINAEQILPVCRALRNTQQFDQVAGITAVDWWPTEPRFEVIYLLHSYQTRARVRLSVWRGEDEDLDSTCSIWRGANWYEREVFDLFGIRFRNHPNLERIMMPADWEGHPLRKDYPVHGHKYSYRDE
jgi:NADH-quinone oxidoreductase subunit C